MVAYDLWNGLFDDYFGGDTNLLPDLNGLKGRRNRVVRRLVNIYPAPALVEGWALYVQGMPVVPMKSAQTISIEEVEQVLREHNLPGPLPLRDSKALMGESLARVYRTQEELDEKTVRDAELPEYLQDLADEITVDITEACAALDNPNLWYPGVDGGIDPVPDEHVEMVIKALQRELDRELRVPFGVVTSVKLSSAPLAELPRHIQRALVERRRLRFQQWGIGRQEWEKNEWSLWNVPEDPEWEPRRRFA